MFSSAGEEGGFSGRTHAGRLAANGASLSRSPLGHTAIAPLHFETPLPGRATSSWFRTKLRRSVDALDLGESRRFEPHLAGIHRDPVGEITTTHFEGVGGRACRRRGSGPCDALTHRCDPSPSNGYLADSRASFARLPSIFASTLELKSLLGSATRMDHLANSFCEISTSCRTSTWR